MAKRTKKKSGGKKTKKKAASGARRKKSSKSTSARRATMHKKSARKGAEGKPKRRTAKAICYFGETRTDGGGDMKELLGGKGANLAEMTAIGLPVPPGFTITTDVCAQFYESKEKLWKSLIEDIRKNVRTLEKETGKKFGDSSDPLLVSVRSGAAVSMPGMMDTVLNLGLTDKAVAGLANKTGNPRFAYDAYRRLIHMFGDVVMGVDHEAFEEAFEQVRSSHAAEDDAQVPEQGIVELCDRYKAVYEQHVGAPFPQDPHKQLEHSITAVFKSWNTPRAVRYRRINEITGLIGTAVNVQAMAYGNMGDDSATGVAFTRNPSTGENKFYGEFLINAQGEDVVAGIRTPRPLDELKKWNKDVYEQLVKIKKKLEKHYRDMQDIEFTVEQGKLYMLQTRTGKRTGPAAVTIACDMVKEKLIKEDEALLRVPAGDLTQLLLPSFDPKAKESADILATGLPASPGVAVGKPAFTAHEAVDRAHAGERVILVRKETSPEDIDGMHTAVGILTSTGGMTSHAAVVARGWGKCCVAGAGAITIDAKAGKFTVGGRTFSREDVISLDGATGEVMAGEVETTDPEMGKDFATLMKWADKRRTLKVRTNADTPQDAKRAREFGAQGIGLCRTEHMFFEGERILAMREMILAETVEAREKALAKLLPFQRDDFTGIFQAMDGLPVTVRLLDPPLHEFLPHEDDAVRNVAKNLGYSEERVRQRVNYLQEANPMLGHRGCRLAVTYPEILRMQVRAIVEAAIDCLEKGVKARPEIMIPLAGLRTELALLRAETLEVIAAVRKERGFTRKLDIMVGAMIEVPRAAITAGEMAEEADFFSFGTNDLTQLTFGFSRDDVNTFLPDYLDQEILERDPFQSLDVAGVGKLVEVAVTHGRKTNPDLKIGICGEHGGDPMSVGFCHNVGMEYVSCSPFRVPIARLAAAQAAIRG